MKQLPFLGKQTKPAALRKDLWRPLAAVTFPSGSQGLTAYRELREYRKRHEHEWDYEELGARSRLDAGRKLMDQRANSIADLAAVLIRQERLAKMDQNTAQQQQAEIEKQTTAANARYQEISQKLKELRPTALDGERKDLEEYKQLKAERMRIRRNLKKPMPHYALRGQYHPLNEPSPETIKPTSRRTRRQLRQSVTIEGVGIKWANIMDAEFARTWPAAVIHETLEAPTNRTRHIHPPITSPPVTEPRTEEQAATDKDEANIAVAKASVPKENNAEQDQPPQRSLSQRLLDRVGKITD